MTTTMGTRITFILGICSCGCRKSIGRLRSRHGYLMLYRKGHNGVNNKYENIIKNKSDFYSRY